MWKFFGFPGEIFNFISLDNETDILNIFCMTEWAAHIDFWHETQQEKDLDYSIVSFLIKIKTRLGN